MPTTSVLSPRTRRVATRLGSVCGLAHHGWVPRISAFYGIVIAMYHDEIHHPGRAHFHARYGDNEASIDIESLAVIAGELPPRAARLVVEWAELHRAELRANWDRARRHERLEPIEPLR
jgi:hypothetical protein